MITGLKEGTFYNVSLKAYVTVDGEEYYGKPGESVTSKAVKGKKANPLTIKPKTATVKYRKLKKKARKGKKSFKKCFKINKTTGKLTVKKGLKKGIYKVRIKVKALGNSSYKASAVKTVKFIIKVK